MNLAQQTCAACGSLDPAHCCLPAAKLAAAQAGSPLHGPNDDCEKHQAQAQSDGQEAAVHALWQQLVIKSRWAVTRTSDRRRDSAEEPERNAAHQPGPMGV